jgi:hypothetical protein
MAKDNKGTPKDAFWHKVFHAHKTKGKAQRAEWSELARMYRGSHMPKEGEERNGLVEDDATRVPSAYAYAFADTLAANVVPTNPAVTIKANRAALDDAATFRTYLSNSVFRKERLGEKLWALTTRAAIWGRCWAKATWSKDAKRPVIRVIDPHYVWADLDAECEEDMRYIIEVAVLTKGEFTQRVKRKGSQKKQFYRSDALEEVEFGRYPDWLAPESDITGETSTPDEDIVRENYQYCVIYEVYDFRENKFMHYADGVRRPLFEGDLPYTHLRNPFKMLTFNDNLADLGGLADASLIKTQVKRMEEYDALEVTHVKTAIPSLVIHEGLVDNIEDFMDAMEMADGPGMVIPLAANPGIGVNEVLGVTPMPTLPAEFGRSRNTIENNIQFTLGLPSYARGEVGQSDVATELALTDTATRTRNARRQKMIYNVIEWCSKAIIGLYHQWFPEEQQLPMRVKDGLDEQQVTASMMKFDGEEDPWAWDYSAHPYTAAEQNEIVQLKQMEAYLPVLLNNPVVDQQKLVKKLLDLLHAPELLAPPQPPPMAPPGPPGAPPLPGGAGPDMGGAGMPPEMAPLLQGGEVLTGAGEQAIPAGLEGGVQPGGGNLEGL